MARVHDSDQLVFFVLRCPACPAGWRKWQSDCYSVWHHAVNTTLYARDFCQSLGADLPTVADDGVDTFLNYVFDTAAQTTVCLRCIFSFFIHLFIRLRAAKRTVRTVVGWKGDVLFQFLSLDLDAFGASSDSSVSSFSTN